MTDAGDGPEARAQRYVLEYAYKRSTGPIIGRFLAGLRDGKILGARTANGRVMVPPTEHDPDTMASIAPGDLIEVGLTGTVTTWSWMDPPRKGQPLDRPFAWALIALDGADTALLHAVDAGDPTRIRSGARVRARFRADPKGELADLECFDLEGAIASTPGHRPEGPASEPVTRFLAPVRHEYEVSAGRLQARFLAGLIEGRILGQRCGTCAKVYVPPPAGCPTCAVPFTEEVQVSDAGTVTSFCVVHIPHQGQQLEVPYVAASVVLDGASTPLFHLIREIPVAEVRMGLRVRAVWSPPAARRPTVETILHFRPTGEPDAPFETYREHL